MESDRKWSTIQVTVSFLSCNRTIPEIESIIWDRDRRTKIDIVSIIALIFGPSESTVMCYLSLSDIKGMKIGKRFNSYLLNFWKVMHLHELTSHGINIFFESIYSFGIRKWKKMSNIQKSFPMNSKIKGSDAIFSSCVRHVGDYRKSWNNCNRCRHLIFSIWRYTHSIVFMIKIYEI